jgi:hypothetical protein
VIEPPADKCRKSEHPEELHFGCHAFDAFFAFDIEVIIYESQDAHTKNSEEDDISLLSSKETMVGPSEFLNTE